jgi:hypothetical protein
LSISAASSAGISSSASATCISNSSADISMPVLFRRHVPDVHSRSLDGIKSPTDTEFRPAGGLSRVEFQPLRQILTDCAANYIDEILAA